MILLINYLLTYTSYFSELPKLHFHIRPKLKPKDMAAYTKAEAKYYFFFKLLSICHFCSFNLNFANPFLMITSFIHKDPVILKALIFLPIPWWWLSFVRFKPCRLKNLVTSYKFKCFHWWKIYI